MDLLRRIRRAIWRQHASLDEGEEPTGVHKMTIDVLRHTRWEIGALISELRTIQEEVSALVESGDLEQRGGGDGRH